jgi:hypothetical protein
MRSFCLDRANCVLRSRRLSPHHMFNLGILLVLYNLNLYSPMHLTCFLAQCLF